MVDNIDAKAHDLAPLEIGDRVKVQNQAGTAKTRWSRTGTVLEINNEFDQYLVRMDGSRRTTARNRSDLLLHRRSLASRDVARLRRAAAAHLGEHPAESAKAALRETGAALNDAA